MSDHPEIEPTSADPSAPAPTETRGARLQVGPAARAADRPAPAAAEADGSAAAPEAESAKPRRGRVATEFAECSLGEILNVSPTGLRARYKGSRKRLPAVDERFDLQVRTPDGPVAVRARIAWTKRAGFRTFDIGVEFVAADDKDAVKLKQLASMAGRSIVINEATGGAKLRAG